MREGIRVWASLLSVLLALCLAPLYQLKAQSTGSGERHQVEVYLVPFSHLDFFWGGTREECLARGNRIIAKAIKLAKQSPQFRFLLEDNDFVANYVETHPGSPELDDFKRLVKEGRIEIAPKWAGIFQNLPPGEVLARNLVYGKRYARTVFGVDPQVAHMGDIPGFTPQFPQMLKQASIPFMVMTRMGPSDKSLFYWKAPDGSEVLVWNTLKAYGWGSRLGLHTELNEERRQTLQKEVEEVRATTGGPILMNWGSDLWAPTEKLVENIEILNKDFPSARFIFATPLDFFKRVMKTPALSELSGEIPSSWPNAVSSLAHMWPLAIPATNTLLTAEKFAAINYALGYADYPQPEFEFLWRKLIESMDHNHDGQGGAIGDDRKIGYSQLAILRGGEIMRDTLRNLAERVEIPIAKGFPIVVFNPQGWARSDVVKAHATLYGDVAPRDIAEYKKGMRLVDEKGTAIPFHVEQYSENISRALELVFIAHNVPPLGYRTYYLTPTEQPEAVVKATEIKLDSQNDLKEPRRPLGADVMENDFYRVTVDKATGRVAVFDKELSREVCKDLEIVGVEERGGNYIGIEPLSGRTIFNSISQVEVEEDNAVRAVMKITGQIADIPIIQRLILYRGLKRLDLENTLTWKGPRFIRLQQLFPIMQPQAQIHYGVPFGATAADNLIPRSGPHLQDEIKLESWLQSRQLQDWIAAGTSDWGLTIATDHQLVKLGEGIIRAEMLRGARFASVKVVRGDEITSLYYPPPGTYLFKYSLSSGSGDWKTMKSYQAGMNFNHPLIPISVVDDISRKSLPPTHSFGSWQGDNLVLSTVKKSDLEDAILLRFFEIKGSRTETPVEFLSQRRNFQEVNLLEESVGRSEERVLKVNPYQIKTIKMRIGK
jgi:alpha-mannosidase